MLPRPIAWAAALVLVLALAACGSKTESSAIPAGAAELKELRRQDPNASRLLSGGLERYESELEARRGKPVVVNQWASWCGPCRVEFPYFQRQSKELAGRVAFLGVNSKDSSDDAEQFLAEFPTPFGHVADPDGEIARSYGGARTFPTTIYYDRSGDIAFVHKGAYRDEASLRADIDRYALGG